MPECDSAATRPVRRNGPSSRPTKTFEAVVTSQYLPHKRRELRPQSYKDVERHLLRHAKPLHRLQLETISRRDIAACLAAARVNAGRIAANRARNSLSGLFSWAMAEGLVESNPVIGTIRVEELSRERVLSLDELRLIWNALPDSDFGSIMKLLMLTGARAGEIAGLRREEFRDDAILLPGSRTKNGREHLIPVSAPASAILATALGRSARSADGRNANKRSTSASPKRQASRCPLGAFMM
jgi:integrase